ncbi:hypothetical protein ACFZB2_05235 [Streptomyces bobili]|uniref:hypothetical protein n=1 Tax=Streptomyces bobili TaxID=67280 RepID=UPI0036E6A005
MMMPIQYFWRHPLAEEVREEGRVEALAEVTLRILRVRGIDVPDDVRARVEACTDLDQLIRWSERAVHAARADDLFALD